MTQTDPLNLLLLIRVGAFPGTSTPPQTGGAILKRLPYMPVARQERVCFWACVLFLFAVSSTNEARMLSESLMSR